MPDTPPLCCPICLRGILGDEEGRHVCPCGQEFEVAANVLSYSWKPLLFERYRRQFLRNSALNNNGYLSYLFLPDASISLPEREDVDRFRSYLLEHAERGTLLDVGCGPMEVPGYLAFESGDRADFKLIGLDPISNSPFRGFRIVGCAEFVPLCSASVDTVVFATSLDHVCHTGRTIEEARRILRPGGAVVVWMSDRTAPFGGRARRFASGVFRRLRSPRVPSTDHLREGPYVIYPDLTVMYVPRGAADPYHARLEHSEATTREFERRGFRLEDRSKQGADEVFLTFRAVG